MLGFLRANAWMVAVIGVLVVALFWMVDPTPPRVVHLATGPEEGAYHAFAERLAARLQADGLEVRLRPSNGSVENLRLLRDAASNIDLALVQSGVATEEDRAAELSALGSLFLEPVWIFTRADARLSTLHDLRGKRIAIGVDGSGTLPVAMQVLEANGLIGAGLDDTVLIQIGGEEAADALRSGTVDAAFFVGAPGSKVVQSLWTDPALDFHGLRRERAYQSWFPRLAMLVVGEGQLDLARDIPAEDRVMLSAAVTLVANDRFHAGLTPLLLEAATELLQSGGRLEQPGEFPAARPTDFPLLPEAEHYLRNGPPFLMRYLPFWVATVVFRAVILVIPLLAVLIPLIRIAPPIYVWRTRKKIFRWYKDLREIDQRLRSDKVNETVEQDLASLRRLEDEVLQIKVPLSYADELYDLHLHIEWVIRRLERQMREPATDAATARS